MARKSIIKPLVAWRNQGRGIHAQMVQMLGVPFPESQLLSVVDGMLQIGSEGLAKGFRAVKPKALNGKRTKRRFKGKKGQTIVALVKRSLDSTPRTGKEVYGKIKEPNVDSGRIVKTLAQLFLRKECKRQGKPGSYRYYVST